MAGHTSGATAPGPTLMMSQSNPEEIQMSPGKQEPIKSSEIPEFRPCNSFKIPQHTKLTYNKRKSSSVSDHGNSQKSDFDKNLEKFENNAVSGPPKYVEESLLVKLLTSFKDEIKNEIKEGNDRTEAKVSKLSDEIIPELKNEISSMRTEFNAKIAVVTRDLAKKEEVETLRENIDKRFEEEKNKEDQERQKLRQEIEKNKSENRTLESRVLSL